MTKAVRVALLGTCLLAAPALAQADEEVSVSSPKTSALELRFGGYYPDIDSEPGLSTPVFRNTFGTSSLLLFELEYDYQVFQKLGSLAVGFSAGYAEKYAPAITVTGQPSAEKTAFKVLPLKLLAVYRFDYAAVKWGVPLVPYVKGGLAYMPWWIDKGTGIEFVGGRRGAGGKWGYVGVAGLSFMLDFLEPRLARDFDTNAGVNHSYLFAEYNVQRIDDFGGPGFDLSSRHWMFGFAVEF